MKVRPVPEKGLYELLEPLRYLWNLDYSMEVPVGFEWNGASIPRAAWTALGITPFDPRVMRASCVHDWFYTLQNGSRRAADELFRKMLIEDGISEPDSYVMYLAVRQFGTAYWKDAEDLRREEELLEIQNSKANN